MPLLSTKELENLHEYQYSGKDYSLSSKYFMQRYWSAAVQWVPLTMAPNMVTLLGFIVSTSTSLWILYFALWANGALPNWLWLWASVSLFAYQTLDAIDGKHARRIKCGSPLGELFDHGCDALFTPLLCTTTCLAVGYDPLESFIHCMTVNMGLFLSLFEQFCTGTLDLGYINGPVEGILLSCITFFWSAIVGPRWWSTPFAAPLIDFSIGGGLRLSIQKPNDATLLLAVVLAALTASVNLFHAFAAAPVHDKIRRLPTLGVPLSLLFIFAFMVHVHPEILLGPYRFAPELAFGWFVSYTVTRMTVARLCKATFNPFTVPYFILLGLMLMAWGAPRGQSHVVSTAFVVSCVLLLAAYMKMIIGVFAQFARFLEINVLTLTAKQRARVLQSATTRIK